MDRAAWGIRKRMKYSLLFFSFFSLQLHAGLRGEVVKNVEGSPESIENWEFNFDEQNSDLSSNLASSTAKKATERDSLLNKENAICSTRCCSCLTSIFIAVWGFCIGKRDVKG